MFQNRVRTSCVFAQRPPQRGRESAAGWRRKRDGGLKNNRSRPVEYPLRLFGTALDCRFAKRVARRGFAKAAFANGALFDHDLRRSGQNRRHSQFWRAPMRAPPSRGSPGSWLSLSESRSPGVLREQAIPERASRGFAGMRFANGGLFDHPHAGCGQNRRHSQSRARAHVCQAKNAHSSWRILRLRALALEKLALRTSKPHIFTPASGGDPVFGLPLTLWPEYSGVHARTYILFEHPNAVGEFK